MHFVYIFFHKAAYENIKIKLLRVQLAANSQRNIERPTAHRGSAAHAQEQRRQAQAGTQAQARSQTERQCNVQYDSDPPSTLKAACVMLEKSKEARC